MKKVFSLEEIKKSQKINLIDDYLLNGIKPISYEFDDIHIFVLSYNGL